MIDKRIMAFLGAVAVIVGWTVTIESRYEKQAIASQTHELIAAEQEVGKLETELKLLDLELKFLRDRQQERQLSSEEGDRLEYLRQRRLLIEARLLESVRSG